MNARITRDVTIVVPHEEKRAATQKKQKNLYKTIAVVIKYTGILLHLL